ncbi:hypothetical protein IVA88_09010 [Bradyrhizobium sp. 149]|uniref:hypothetical protein n=1 Tax=Bradyrhizobium sp. 149 TaxID=2782624 RepID=UPI001FF9079E|nr:hypothetical protein [Bradyrhizobium sp. 149]MCK1651575.1 hypothetical protein [Bradyrhizobium sp. 149]
MPTLPMKLGVPLDQMSVFFFASLALAVWLIYVFCQRKFAERSVTGSGDFIYQMLPRQLATHEEYSHGFLIYFGSMATILVVLSLLGANNLEQLGLTLPKHLSYLGMPLALAFVLMGALPNVPGLMLIETNMRQYAHERAYIPDAARATAERIAAADFDFAAYAGEALRSPQMRGILPGDFTRSRHTIEHSWARLCCLVYALKSYRMEGFTGALDASLLQDYQSDLDLIESQKRSMEPQVTAYRSARESDPYYTNEELRRCIVDNLRKLYILLGCAVRLKTQPNDDIDLALRPFGVMLKPTLRPQGTGDLKLVSLTTVAMSVVLLGLAADGLGQLGLWTTSAVFPQTVMQPFWDAAATFVPYAAAIIVADLVRRRAIGKGRWFVTSGQRQQASGANYVRVAVICGIAGYLALIIWGLTQAPPTEDSFRIEIPSALLAMVTGAFYVFHLDNAEAGQRPSRAWELGAETVITGLCGLIAACATWQIILGTAGAAVDRIILTTLINAAVGFALAWYIPQAAAALRYDPLVNESQERVRALQTAAQARLGGAAAVWLDQQHPVLDGVSPRLAAAAGADGFERAIALLQGPQSLTA